MVRRRQPTKKKRRLLRKQQKGKGLSGFYRRSKVEKILWIAAAVLIGGGILGGGWYSAARPSLPASEIISEQGIHWHTDLTIKILGQYQEIPANTGLGVLERPVHTHDTDGVIHMEFSGLVTKDDVRLGQFFEIWGKQFSQECIFNRCNGPDGEVSMLVNGQPNFEFENYVMGDGDKIEIIFE